jgi:outer membrane receptor protein involved in Fe transport
MQPPTLLKGLWLASGLSLALAGAAHAQARAPRHHFHIPAQDAATALRDFARQSGRQVLVDYSLVAGKTVPVLDGDYDDAFALAKLAESAGLQIVVDTGAAIILGPKRRAPPPTPIFEVPPSPLEEVVVTATKRAESILNVPVSISASSQPDLKQRGARSLQDAVRSTPGVRYLSGGSGSGVYAIRGVNTGTAVGNMQSPIGLYLDDIDILDPFFPRITPNPRMFDVDRVEVLRGPQGTLFGSGALGGAIRIIANKPDAGRFAMATEETATSTQGGRLGYAFDGMVNIPLAPDRLALRVVGYYEFDGGYVDNIATQETNTNHAVSRGGRIELKWTPGPAFSLSATALFQNDRPNDAGFSFYGSKAYAYNNVVPNRFLNDTKIYGINAAYDAGWARLSSLTTYADRQEVSQVDFTPRAVALMNLSDPATVIDAGPSRTFSQEIRLTSPDVQRPSWLIGGLYLSNRHTVDEEVVIPRLPDAMPGVTTSLAALTLSHFRTDQTAIFGEASYALVENLTVTAGARILRDVMHLDQILGGPLEQAGVEDRQTHETAFTPKFALTYRPRTNLSFYAQASRGYRVGQNNVRAAVPREIIPLTYRPDRLWNYELGEKATLFANRLRIDGAVYYIDWKRIQLNERTPAFGINYIGNAGDAAILGAEVELEAHPTAPLSIGAAVTLNHSRLTRIEPGVAAAKGDRLPGSAGFASSGWVQYTHVLSGGLSLYGRLDGQYVGAQYSELRNATALRYGHHGSFDLRLGARQGRYELIAYVNNLAGGDRKVSALLVSATPVAIRQRPRTFGLTARSRF